MCVCQEMIPSLKSALVHYVVFPSVKQRERAPVESSLQSGFSQNVRGLNIPIPVFLCKNHIITDIYHSLAPVLSEKMK